MPFKVLCACGVALLAGDDLESFKVACPECGGYTLLPSIPDPYKLPSNAEMIALEEEEIEEAPKPRERAPTVRKRGGVARTSRAQEGEISSTNIILIVVLIVVVCIGILVAFAYAV